MTPERFKEFDYVYINNALMYSTLSRAVRNKVGCIVVKDGNVLNFGFNGTPSGFDNTCEYECKTSGALTTKPEVLHAESNTFMKMLRQGQSAAGATLYVTLSPCYECAKLIVQAGIKRVVFVDCYRIFEESIGLLNRANIQVQQIDPNTGDIIKEF